MIKLNSKWLMKSIFFIPVFAVIFSSCEKDDEVNPDYIGTWSAIETFTEDGITTQAKDIMTFSKDKFYDLGQLYDESANKFIDYIKFNGTISVSGSSMYIKILEIGVSSLDVNTGKPTGAIILYKEGSSQFNNILTHTGLFESFASEYSVSGSKMTIKTDYNDDGDYSENEIEVYTKQ